MKSRLLIILLFGLVLGGTGTLFAASGGRPASRPVGDKPVPPPVAAVAQPSSSKVPGALDGAKPADGTVGKPNPTRGTADTNLLRDVDPMHDALLVEQDGNPTTADSRNEAAIRFGDTAAPRDLAADRNPVQETSSRADFLSGESPEAVAAFSEARQTASAPAPRAADSAPAAVVQAGASLLPGGISSPLAGATGGAKAPSRFTTVKQSASKALGAAKKGLGDGVQATVVGLKAAGTGLGVAVGAAKKAAVTWGSNVKTGLKDQVKSIGESLTREKASAQESVTAAQNSAIGQKLARAGETVLTGAKALGDAAIIAGVQAGGRLTAAKNSVGIAIGKARTAAVTWGSDVKAGLKNQVKSIGESLKNEKVAAQETVKAAKVSETGQRVAQFGRDMLTGAKDVVGQAAAVGRLAGDGLIQVKDSLGASLRRGKESVQQTAKEAKASLVKFGKDTRLNAKILGQAAAESKVGKAVGAAKKAAVAWGGDVKKAVKDQVTELGKSLQNEKIAIQKSLAAVKQKRADAKSNSGDKVSLVDKLRAKLGSGTSSRAAVNKIRAQNRTAKQKKAEAAERKVIEKRTYTELKREAAKEATEKRLLDDYRQKYSATDYNAMVSSMLKTAGLEFFEGKIPTQREISELMQTEQAGTPKQEALSDLYSLQGFRDTLNSQASLSQDAKAGLKKQAADQAAAVQFNEAPKTGLKATIQRLQGQSTVEPLASGSKIAPLSDRKPIGATGEASAKPVDASPAPKV